MADDKSRLPLGKMERGVVARGRTVIAATGEKRIGKYSEDGKPIMVPILKTFGPDQEIELPAPEIAWLRSIGHLIDPRAPAPLPAEGARVAEMSSGQVGFVGQEARA